MQRSTFLNNLKSGRTLVVTGDKAKIIDKKHSAYGMTGDVVCTEPHGIQWLDIEPLTVLGLYENDYGKAVKFHDGTQYDVVMHDRQTLNDIFNKPTVYIGVSYNSCKNSGFSGVLKLESVYDFMNTLVRGVVQVSKNGNCQEPPQIYSLTSSFMKDLISNILDDTPATSYNYEQISLDTYSAVLNNVLSSKSDVLSEPCKYIIMYQDDYALLVDHDKLKPTIERIISEGVNPSTINIYEFGRKVDFSFDVNITLPEG